MGNLKIEERIYHDCVSWSRKYSLSKTDISHVYKAKIADILYQKNYAQLISKKEFNRLYNQAAKQIAQKLWGKSAVFLSGVLPCWIKKYEQKRARDAKR